MENQKIDPHKYDQLIFDKCPIPWRKGSLSTNGAEATGYS